MSVHTQTCDGTNGGPTGTAVELTGVNAEPDVGVTVPAVMESVVEDDGDCGLVGKGVTGSVPAGLFTIPEVKSG